MKKGLGIWPRGSHNENLKEIHAITSEIIDATDGRTDGRTTDDRRRTNFDFMSSADIVKQSEKITILRWHHNNDEDEYHGYDYGTFSVKSTCVVLLCIIVA